MSGDAKKVGQELALKLVNRINDAKKTPPAPPQEQETPVIETTALVEAIQALSENRVDLSPVIEAIQASQSETLDIGPLVKAINELELNFDVDVSAIVEQLIALNDRPATDTKVIANKLDALVKAMEKNTSVLSELVTVAKTAKVITYDIQGRIIKIGLEVNSSG